MPNSYVDHILKHIKTFKSSIEGAAVTANNFRQGYKSAAGDNVQMMIRFTDDSSVDIWISQNNIKINLNYGGPEHKYSPESIRDNDPELAAAKMERELGKWLASSNQETFPRQQCVNRYYLLENLELRIKALGYKKPSKLLVAKVLDSLVTMQLIKRDNANCFILPEMDKAELESIVRNSENELKEEDDSSETKNLGKEIIIEVANRKYPLRILGTEVVSEKELPKSRVYDVLRAAQRVIDGKLKCSKCGGTEGMVISSMYGNREFQCDADRTITKMTNALHFVLKFSDKNIKEAEEPDTSKILSRAGIFKEIHNQLSEYYEASHNLPPEVTDSLAMFTEDLTHEIYKDLKKEQLLKEFDNGVLLSKKLDENKWDEIIAFALAAMKDEYIKKYRKSTSVVMEFIQAKHSDSYHYLISCLSV